MSSYNVPATTPLASGSSPGASSIARTGALSFSLEIQIAAYRMRQRRLRATLEKAFNNASWNRFNQLVTIGNEEAIQTFITSQTPETLSQQRRPGDDQLFEAIQEQVLLPKTSPPQPKEALLTPETLNVFSATHVHQLHGDSMLSSPRPVIHNNANWNRFNKLVAVGDESAIQAFITSQAPENLAQQCRPVDNHNFEDEEEHVLPSETVPPPSKEVVPNPEPLFVRSPTPLNMNENDSSNISAHSAIHKNASWTHFNYLLANGSEDDILAFIDAQTPMTLSQQCRPGDIQLFEEQPAPSPRVSSPKPQEVFPNTEPFVWHSPLLKQQVHGSRVRASPAPVSSPKAVQLPVAGIKRRHEDDDALLVMPKKSRNESVASHSVSVPQRMRLAVELERQEAERLSGLSTAPVPSPNGTPLLVAGIKRRHGDDEELQIMPKKSRNELVASQQVTVPQRMRLAVELKRQEAERFAKVTMRKRMRLVVELERQETENRARARIAPVQSPTLSPLPAPVQSPSPAPMPSSASPRPPTTPQQMRLVFENDSHAAEHLTRVSPAPTQIPPTVPSSVTGIKRRHDDDDAPRVVPKKSRRAVITPRPRLPRIAKSEAAAKVCNGTVNDKKNKWHRARKTIKKPSRPTNTRKMKVKAQHRRAKTAEIPGVGLLNATLPTPSPVTVNQRWTVQSSALTPADVKTVVEGANFEAALYITGVVALCGYFEGVAVAASKTLTAAAKKLPRIIYNDPADKIVQIVAGKQHLVLKSEKGHLFTLGQATEGQLGATSCPHRHRQLEPSPLNMRRTVTVTEKVTSAKTGRARNVKKAVTFTDIGATDLATIGWTAQGKAYRCGTVGAWKSPLLVPCPELDRQ